jgi:chlorobactene glucosyltransferase
MDIYIGLIAIALVLISCIAIINALTFPRLHTAKVENAPLVSVLIPARNEAAVIAGTIRAWLEQDYPNFEVILMDDNSSDRTAQLASDAAEGDPRLRVLSGKELPAGWKGKTWACHQLSQVAKGDFFVFTDADVDWSPTALSALMACMVREQADMYTVWPTQVTKSWSERLVVSQMALVVLAYLPVLAVHFIPWPVFSAANGQCIVLKKESYEKLGGHENVRTAIVEDMAFASQAKRHQLRLRMADGAGLISTRMYHNWITVRDGFAKNILAGHANSLPFLFFSMLFHWSLFLFPWLVLFAAMAGQFDWMPALVMVTLGVLIRALTASITRQRVLDSVLQPISVILLTIISFRAIYWHFHGGPQWKGRAYDG